MSAEQVPLWLEAVKGFSSPLSATVTGLFAVLTAYLGFRFGLAKGEHELKIEKERLEHQQQLEIAKALREERRLKIRIWRQEISNYTSLVIKPASKEKQTVFNLESFVRTEAYLSLRSYLSESQQATAEAIPKVTMTAAEFVSNLRPRLPQYTTPLKVRDMLLVRIDGLEKDWGLI